MSLEPATSATTITMHSLATYRNILTTFASLPHAFRLVHSATAPYASLCVLDSSFNPPTRAHLSLLLASLTPNTRILLLLATSNADKAPVPAALEDRLAMMSLFAQALPTDNVDIALTKHARFLDKSAELEAQYPGAEQTYLTGYDTLIRLLDTKYYPPTHTLAPLEPFFKKNRVRCTMREGWGKMEKQKEYLEAIRRGDREDEGCKREWAERIELVEAEEESLGVSSTAVREAVRSGDEEKLDGLLTPEVKGWVLKRQLYA